MGADPETNLVVFEIRDGAGLQRLTREAPTRSANGVQTIWQALQLETRARGEDVTRIYSEWQPSPQDEAFIRSTFPAAAVTYSFARPAEDEWDDAMAEAARTIRESIEREVERRHPRPGKKAWWQFWKKDPPSAALLLPILRDSDAFSRMVVSRPLGADLAVYLADVTVTPRGSLGIDYRMRAASAGRDEALFAEACANFAKGLRVNAAADGDERVFAVEHAMGLAASALGLPDFCEKASQWTESGELFVAFPDPAHLFVTAFASTRVQVRLRTMVAASGYEGSVALTPSCARLTAAGLEKLP